ncbi:uncharacterized protein LOC141685925 [Apium graveolens]|uniref:uncharacterized protein LOC141685925 n=1 Tax=Apium graveolens TaxID=4045 RepID=UPI003D796B7F
MIQGTTGAFANIETKFEKVESRLDQIASSQKMLESQIGQIANKIENKNTSSYYGDSDSVDDEPNKERLTHHAPIKPYIPLIPFPQRLKNSKLEKQYEKFLKMFHEIHISILFADALAQMPLYVKFMKEVLSNRKKLKEVETITLTEECSAVIQCKIPPKRKDPGSFSLPCTIGELGIRKALCDPGASVSLMPYSMYKRLGLGELKKTKFSLQLTDRSIKYPLGVLEDVLVKVDKFVIPCDFIVLEMNEDVDILIIFGRPFLATAGTNIDVKAGKLILNVGEERVDFDLDQSMKDLSVKTECYVVNVVKEDNDHAFEVEAEIDENSSFAREFQGVTEVEVTLGPYEAEKESNFDKYKICGVAENFKTLKYICKGLDFNFKGLQGANV